MAIERTKSNLLSIGCGGDGTKSTLKFNSFVRVDMKTLSQSELYSLSRSSSYAFGLRKPENDVIPNIQSDHRSTDSITTTTTPKRIFAFSHRRGPRSSISGSDNTQVMENRLILNSLKRLISDGDMAVDNHGEVQKRKRKRKSTEQKEFENLGVINVNGEVIDLTFLASAADDAFESELNRMTDGMVEEDEFLGFLKGLEGRWGSTRKRRKYVDATVFLNVLPVNWYILLSLRPRVRRPSLYCRRFVSPSNVHFNSCKDVAIYLKSQSVTKNDNPHEQGAMMQTETEYQMDLESDNTKMRHNELKNIHANGEEALTEPKNNSEEKRNFKTNCIWCLVEFFREPVDAETLASSCGFICPKCKQDVSWRFESSLSELTHHAD